MANPSSPGGAPAVRATATCSKCGKVTTLPFTPTPGRPVFCRECFSTRPSSGRPPMRSGTPPAGRFGDSKPNAMPRKRMMAQGRKTHFLYDANALLGRTEGGMEDANVRAFLEGLFARGARLSTDDAQIFLDEKVTDLTITPQQREGLGQLVDRYSFWR